MACACSLLRGVTWRGSCRTPTHRLVRRSCCAHMKVCVHPGACRRSVTLHGEHDCTPKCTKVQRWIWGLHYRRRCCLATKQGLLLRQLCAVLRASSILCGHGSHSLACAAMSMPSMKLAVHGLLMVLSHLQPLMWCCDRPAGVAWCCRALGRAGAAARGGGCRRCKVLRMWRWGLSWGTNYGVRHRW